MITMAMVIGIFACLVGVRISLHCEFTYKSVSRVYVTLAGRLVTSSYDTGTMGAELSWQIGNCHGKNADVLRELKDSSQEI